MRSTDTPLNFLAPLVALAVSLIVGGCTSPPSVTPLLRVTERALISESARLNDDAERDSQYARQTLRSLKDAYDRDLEQADGLTADWVRDATSVYVAAREALLRNEIARAHERRQRSDNLQAAASATRRAIGLIEQQDKLLNAVAGEDIRRLLTGQATPQETPR
jgi:hypothetical protein